MFLSDDGRKRYPGLLIPDSSGKQRNCCKIALGKIFYNSS
jgi:hypothetical protein